MNLKDAPVAQMTGTDKQIAWAETIRTEKLKEVRHEIRRAWNAANKEKESNNEQYQVVLEVYQALCDVAEAKTWIDMRNQWASVILRDRFNAAWAARIGQKAQDIAEEIAVPVVEDTDIATAPKMIPTTGTTPTPIVGEFTYEIHHEGQVATGRQHILFDGEKLLDEVGDTFDESYWESVKERMGQITTSFPNLICSLLHIVQTDDNYIMVSR